MIKKIKEFFKKKYSKEYIKFENGEFKTVKKEDILLDNKNKKNKSSIDNKNINIELNKDEENNKDNQDKIKKEIIKALIIIFLFSSVLIGYDVYKTFYIKNNNTTTTTINTSTNNQQNTENIVNNNKNTNTNNNNVSNNSTMNYTKNKNLSFDNNTQHKTFISNFVNLDKELFYTLLQIKDLTNNYLNLQINLPYYYSKIEEIKVKEELIKDSISNSKTKEPLIEILLKRLDNNISLCNNILNALNANKGYSSYLNSLLNKHFQIEKENKNIQNKLFLNYLKVNKIKYKILNEQIVID